MMLATIGMFAQRDDLERAIAALHEAGFDRDEFSVLTHESALKDVVAGEAEEAAAETAGAGALGGSALGGLVGLIGGAASLSIPGIGPALAAGAWATVLGTTAAGAGVGAAYGGLMGALIGFGVVEEQTDIYIDGLKQGGALLLVQPQAKGRLATAEEILIEANGTGVQIIDSEEETT